MKKISLSILLALSLVTVTGVPEAYSQVRNWNTSAREKAQTLNSAAVTALLKKQDAKVPDILHRAIEADPSDPLPYATLGIVLAKSKNYSVALDMLGKSYELKHDPETLLSLGFVYYLQHDYDAAIESFQKALKLNPDCVELYGNMGYAYLRKGEFDKAKESFQSLVKKRPGSQYAYQGLATLRYLEGDIDRAKQAAEHAQSIASYAPVILLLAKINFLAGDKVVAEGYVRQLSALKGKKATFRSMTAFGYPKQRDFHFDPLLVDTFDNGDLLLARTQMLPKNESRRKALAAKGKVEAAISGAAAVTSANPSDFYSLRELALLEMAAGNSQQAADYFTRVLKLCPSCAVDWLHLGRCLALAGKNTEAASAVREYLSKFPNQRISPAFRSLLETRAADVPPDGNAGSSGNSGKSTDKPSDKSVDKSPDKPSDKAVDDGGF